MTAVAESGAVNISSYLKDDPRMNSAKAASFETEEK